MQIYAYEMIICMGLWFSELGGAILLSWRTTQNLHRQITFLQNWWNIVNATVYFSEPGNNDQACELRNVYLMYDHVSISLKVYLILSYLISSLSLYIYIYVYGYSFIYNEFCDETVKYGTIKISGMLYLKHIINEKSCRLILHTYFISNIHCLCKWMI